MPRPEPGHLGWLEKQSMLRQSGEYIAQVSQTERIWLHGGGEDRTDTLLKAAPVWLEWTASLQENEKSSFASLGALVDKCADMGVSGIFLGSISEPQNQFLTKQFSEGGLPASLEIDPALGGQQAFDALAEIAEKAEVQLGADLAGAATARGPDFILQARQASGYAGLYAMLPVPRDFWKLLPETSEWDCVALKSAQIADLSAEGILPRALVQDRLPGHALDGWACTGEVMGADGQIRRWLYRFSGNPENPVLMWQDPGGNARKIFSASIIARTGLCGISLAGLRLTPIMGLEPAEDSAGIAQSYGPGLEALKDMSAQIHRYGGWSIQADSVDERLLEAALRAGCDFCRDDVSGLLFRLAAARGNSGRLLELLRSRKEKGIPANRLARGFAMGKDGQEWLFSGLRDEKALIGEYRDLSANPEAQGMDVIAWNSGMPGLLFFAGSPGKDFFSGEDKRRYQNLFRLRGKHHLAAASESLVIGGENSSLGACLSRLPQGGYWLVAANFGAKPATLRFKLPEKIEKARDAEKDADKPSGLVLSGRLAELDIPAHEVRNIIFVQ